MNFRLYAPEDGSGGAAGSGSAASASTAAPPGNAGAGSPPGGTFLEGTAPAGSGGAQSGQSQSAAGGSPEVTPGAGGTTAPVQPVQKHFVDGWIGPDGKIDKTAYERLPENLRPFKDVFSKYDTPEQLLSSLAHAQYLNGKKGLMPLPANASEQAKAEFNARMRDINGVPEKPEGYGVEKPKELPDDQWNAPYVGEIVGILHKYNVPPAAVKELLATDQKFAAGMRAQLDQAKTQSFETTRTKVVQAFGNDFDKRLGTAKRMAATLGLNIKDPAIGNNADVIIALDKAASFISEDKLVKTNDAGAQGTNDREKARSIVFEKSNPLYEAYHDPRHPNHKAATDQVATYNASWAAQQKTG